MNKLTAHRTMALQVMLADNTHVALAALAHTLVQQVVLRTFNCNTALSVRSSTCDRELAGAADDLKASRAWGDLQGRMDQWRGRLPEDVETLLTWLIAQPQDTLLELLALCTALSTNTMVGRDGDHPGDALTVAVGLDMADWWTPTAGSYLNQIPKALIVKDVAEAVSAERAVALAKLKKGEAVVKAEAMLAGTRWLPTPLRRRAA